MGWVYAAIIIYLVVMVLMALGGLFTYMMDLNQGDKRAGARIFFNAFIWPVALARLIVRMREELNDE